MLNEMTLLCLLLLVIAHGFLIKGCFQIKESIPTSTDTISNQFDTVSHLLNELCDIIADLGGGGNTQAIQNPPMGGSIPEMLSTILMNRFSMAQTDSNGNTQQEEWQVQQNNSPPTLETENQLD
jgi:hypothetical protein